MPKRKKHITPKPGSTFRKEYKREHYILSVIEDGGQTHFRVGKTTFRTPTAAAKSITGSEVNGWNFWGII